MSQSTIVNNLPDALADAQRARQKLEGLIYAADKAEPNATTYTITADEAWDILTDLTDSMKVMRDAIEDIKKIVT
jgi:hypothetical protein